MIPNYLLAAVFLVAWAWATHRCHSDLRAALPAQPATGDADD